jgi:hypothetical protein
LILGKIIAKIAYLGSKIAFEVHIVWENCMILMKISIGKRPFKNLCDITPMYGGTEVTCKCFYLSGAHKVLCRGHKILSHAHKIIKWWACDTVLWP